MNGLDGVQVALLVVVFMFGFFWSIAALGLSFMRGVERDTRSLDISLLALASMACLFAAGWIARGAL